MAEPTALTWPAVLASAVRIMDPREDATQERLTQIIVFDGRHRIVVQAAAYGLRMRPSSHHVRHTLTHELTARIGKSWLGAHLRLRRANENE